MDSKELGKVTKELNTRYPDIGIHKIELDDNTGKASFFMKPTNKVLASLPNDKAVNLRVSETAATLRRDAIDRSALDLIKRSPYEDDPKNIFKRAMKYYFENDVYGSHIDILTNFAAKGFENDIDDDKIKSFYDVWCFDVNFKQIIDWMFFDFFRIGMVRTYKIIGKYEPGVSYLSPIPGKKIERGIIKQIIERAERIQKKREKKAAIDLEGKKAQAAKKKVWSKGYLPVSYTILNPLLVTIEGSLLFDNASVTLEPSAELRAMLTKISSELTDDEKMIIKNLPSEFKAQAKAGTIKLDPQYVGVVDYRKMPYERYPKPRGVKAFDSLEYKNSLREADLSTLDGISNYILKITVGNDEFPVTDQSQLETVAKLFDTPSKAFDVVWNHTLQVERIVSPEISEILGQEKYMQVNEDITGALAFSRALVDGITDMNTGTAGLVVKTVIEEINYARRQVTRWVYNEYGQIADVMGFDRFPKIRWDNTILRDIILYMSTISQLVDRRMLSYQTALEQLGFDFNNEFKNMTDELPDVLKGVLGIVGSPFQRSGGGIQPAQRAPKGTPSGGRPSGQPAKTKQTKTTKKAKIPNQAPSNQPAPKGEASLKLIDLVSDMSEEEFTLFVKTMSVLRNKKDGD
jgi:hypothetical protein